MAFVFMPNHSQGTIKMLPGQNYAARETYAIVGHWSIQHCKSVVVSAHACIQEWNSPSVACHAWLDRTHSACKLSLTFQALYGIRVKPFVWSVAHHSCSSSCKNLSANVLLCLSTLQRPQDNWLSLCLWFVNKEKRWNLDRGVCPRISCLQNTFPVPLSVCLTVICYVSLQMLLLSLICCLF